MKGLKHLAKIVSQKIVGMICFMKLFLRKLWLYKSNMALHLIFWQCWDCCCQLSLEYIGEAVVRRVDFNQMLVKAVVFILLVTELYSSELKLRVTFAKSL